MVLRGFLALAVSIAVTPVITLGLRRLRVMDVPNRRSSHQDPTPRGGGIGVALAVALAVALGPELTGVSRAALLLCGVAFALVGLMEDVVGVSARRRLPLLFAAAAVPLPWMLRTFSGGPWAGLALSAFVVACLVAYTNAFNFMDGINGLAAAQALVAGGAWFVVGQAAELEWLSAMSLILAGAALGFLPYNAPRARVFLGDVGSYYLGALIAYITVEALRSGAPPEAVAGPLAVFLADTGVTLARRIARGDRWFEAHREHVYQRLTVQLGGSHMAATGAVVTAMAACAALGALSLTGSLGLRLAGDAGIVAVLAAYLAAPALHARAGLRQTRPGTGCLTRTPPATGATRLR